MSENPESDEFEDDDGAPIDAGEGVDVDRVLRDLDRGKKRGQKMPEPPWRRLERLREEKRFAELTSDFDDYDVGTNEDRQRRKARRNVQS